MYMAFAVIVGLITSVGGFFLFCLAGAKLGKWLDDRGSRHLGDVLGGIFGIFGVSAGMLLAVYIFS
jgi:hypothetical protein